MKKSFLYLSTLGLALVLGVTVCSNEKVQEVRAEGETEIGFKYIYDGSNQTYINLDTTHSFVFSDLETGQVVDSSFTVKYKGEETIAAGIAYAIESINTSDHSALQICNFVENSQKGNPSKGDKLEIAKDTIIGKFIVDQDYSFLWDGEIWNLSFSNVEEIKIANVYDFGGISLLYLDAQNALDNVAPTVIAQQYSMYLNDDLVRNVTVERNATFIALHIPGSYEVGDVITVTPDYCFGSYKFAKTYYFTWDGSKWSFSCDEVEFNVTEFWFAHDLGVYIKVDTPFDYANNAVISKNLTIDYVSGETTSQVTVWVGYCSDPYAINLFDNEVGLTYEIGDMFIINENSKINEYVLKNKVTLLCTGKDDDPTQNTFRIIQQHSGECTSDGNWVTTYPGGDDCGCNGGVDVSHCIYCNEEIAKPTEHTYELIGHVDSTSCLEEGYDIFECSVCHNSTYTDNFTDPIDHKHNHIEGTAATCTENGVLDHYKCDDCETLFVLEGDTYIEVSEEDLSIPATGHKYVLVNKVEATCTEDGVKEHYECEHCHKLYEKVGDKYIEKTLADFKVSAHGHEYVNGVCKHCDIQEQKENEKGGCGGSIITSSVLVLLLSTFGLSLSIKGKNKE